jgi:hypothetical protein
MPDEDFHLADHARSQAHDSRFRGNDEWGQRRPFPTVSFAGATNDKRLMTHSGPRRSRETNANPNR